MYFRASIMSDLQHPLKRREKAVVTALLVTKPPALLCDTWGSSFLPLAAWLGSRSSLHSAAICRGGVVLAQAINTESY